MQSQPRQAQQSLITRLMHVRMPFWIVLPLVLLMLISGIMVGAMVTRQREASCPLAQATCTQFTTFWQAWTILEQRYVDPKALKDSSMVDGAIQGMVASIGDTGHTRYLPPDVAKAEREALQGSFEGIGAYINVQEGQPIIVAPIEGSPAERAGLRPNDLILKVNGEDVHGITVDELRNRVRGPRGTQVQLTIQHSDSNSPIDVTITRDEINVPSVTWRMLPNNTAYIRLIQFSANAGDDMKQALQTARSQGATGIVLDLRNNPGGLVQQLIEVASQFLPKGTTVLIEQDRDGKQEKHTTIAGGAAGDLKMVVLVNNNSASSAEILAAALSEAGRAKVFGEPTFGTATVLSTVKLDNGGELRVGTSEWLTPKGKQVRGVGITPDELVEMPVGAVPLTPAEASTLDVQGLHNSKDAQLIRALEELGTLPAK